MKLRASIPLAAYLNAGRVEDLSPTIVFKFKKLQVHAEFVGNDPLDLPGPPVVHFRRLRGMKIELTGDEGLKTLLATDKSEALLQVVVKVTNRVLLAIRNFGTVAHLQP
jgi:CTP:molybdopterin cytidylyltransferase MocA